MLQHFLKQTGPWSWNRTNINQYFYHTAMADGAEIHGKERGNRH